MGAFLGIGEVGVWTSNRERNALLDWFAENRCQPNDDRWSWCKSDAQRWTGRCIELAEFRATPEEFATTEEEQASMGLRAPACLPLLIEHLQSILLGKWSHTTDSRPALDWRYRHRPPARAPED